MIYSLALLYIYKPSLGEGKLPQNYFLIFVRHKQFNYDVCFKGGQLMLTEVATW